MPMTLSHSEPALTSNPNSLWRARASQRALFFASHDVYVFPEMPHVYGFFDASCGTARYLLSSTKSGNETVSGMSIRPQVSLGDICKVASIISIPIIPGTLDGGVNTILGTKRTSKILDDTKQACQSN